MWEIFTPLHRDPNYGSRWDLLVSHVNSKCFFIKNNKGSMDLTQVTFPASRGLVWYIDPRLNAQFVPSTDPLISIRDCLDCHSSGLNDVLFWSWWKIFLEKFPWIFSLFSFWGKQNRQIEFVYIAETLGIPAVSCLPTFSDCFCFFSKISEYHLIFGML